MYMNRLNELQEIYKDNSEWLKFAELKNGLLLTIVGILTGFFDGLISTPIVRVTFIVLNLIIMLICCVSFIPFLNSQKFIVKRARQHYAKKYTQGKLNNIVFYIEIFLLGEQDYRKTVQEVLRIESSVEFSNIENIYLSQIFHISTIASIKYYLFDVAVQILLAVFILLVVQNVVQTLC